MDERRLDVFRIGNGRVRIGGASPDAPAVAELMAWLASRSEVVDVDFRAQTGALEVRYQEPDGAAGAFVRSLQDRVFTLERVPPATPELELAHSLPGRARLRLVGGTDDDTVRLSAWLADRAGVVRANASPASQTVLVVFDPDRTSALALLHDARASERSAWPSVPPELPRTQWRTTALGTAVLAASITGAVPPLAMGAGVALTAVPPVRRAVAALRDGRVTVDLLDVAAIGISIGTGQVATAAFITWLLSVGDLVLERTADRARVAISKLMQLDASEAWRVTEGGVERVDEGQLAVGDKIAIEAGGRVAADGVVVDGLAMVDEKALTGESEPREKKPGDRILAASVVVEGRIVVAVERTGVDTTAAKIVKILEGAGAKPMTLQRETQKIADRVVLPTFALAAGATLLTGQIDRMTSVLITDFGTGIRISVPTSALTAMTLAARRGVLVKGAQYLERLAKTTVVVFDKTGTLTAGAPEIFEVRPTASFDAREIVALTASAEARQHHPIAEAVRRYAERLEVRVPEAQFGSESVAVGMGVAARVSGHSVLAGGARFMQRHHIDVARGVAHVEALRLAGGSALLVAVDGVLAGVIGYADEPRPESAAIVRELKAGSRRRIVLLSGDSRGPVEKVAAKVGVDAAEGELLPEDKAAYVRELQRQGHVVAMIGDGINDAPALALADVGVSLSGGTDVALETADVVLLEGGLANLPSAFDAADDAMASVRRGLGMVIAPNAVAIVLGALGLVSPAVAAAVNNGSTVVAALAGVAPLFLPAKRRPKR